MQQAWISVAQAGLGLEVILHCWDYRHELSYPDLFFPLHWGIAEISLPSEAMGTSSGHGLGAVEAFAFREVWWRGATPLPSGSELVEYSLLLLSGNMHAGAAPSRPSYTYSRKDPWVCAVGIP